MAIVLDTAAVDPGDRAEALIDAMRALSAPHHLVPQREKPIHARLDAWDIGDAGLCRISRCSGLTLTRTAKQVRNEPASVLFVLSQRGGVARREYRGVQEIFRPDQLFMIDFNMPYEVSWRTTVEYDCLALPLDRLALPAETIRSGALRVAASPLSRVVAGVVTSLTEAADAMAADSAAREMGGACSELVRAVLVSAAGAGPGDGAAIPADLLLTEIREFVRRNLRDPDLSAECIARAHSISVRYLYKLCRNADFRLEQWIIEERLERARTDLALPEHSHKSIAAIAAGWGFRDSSHFARRFRAEYGVAPREWRRSALERRRNMIAED